MHASCNSYASFVLSQLRECIHNSIYAQLKAWTNSSIHRDIKDMREAFFIAIEIKILITHKKANKRAYILAAQKHTTFLYFGLTLLDASLASFLLLCFYCSLFLNCFHLYWRGKRFQCNPAKLISSCRWCRIPDQLDVFITWRFL